VKSRLLWNKGTEGMAASVATRSQQVTLSGVAGSAAAKELAGRLALDTRGVSGVDNQLVVGRGGAAPVAAATPAERTMSGVISDDWITTKVNSTFAYSSNVDGATIDVSTRDGVVTLSGTAASGPERERAIELAGTIRGVRVVESQQLRVL
jgi:osmotically-inducible protein OsmY